MTKMDQSPPIQTIFKINFNVIVPSMPRTLGQSLHFRFNDHNFERVCRLRYEGCILYPSHNLELVCFFEVTNEITP